MPLLQDITGNYGQAMLTRSFTKSSATFSAKFPKKFSKKLYTQRPLPESKRELLAQDLIARYNAGLDLSDLSRMTGISVSDLSRKMRAYDPDYVAKAIKFSPRVRNAFVMHLKGVPLKKIGASFGVQGPTVWYWFTRIHPNYRKVARSGALASIGDFLKDKRRRPEEKVRMEKWVFERLPIILASEIEAESASMNQAAEHTLTRYEFSKYHDGQLYDDPRNYARPEYLLSALGSPVMQEAA